MGEGQDDVILALTHIATDQRLNSRRKYAAAKAPPPSASTMPIPHLRGPASPCGLVLGAGAIEALAAGPGMICAGFDVDVALCVDVVALEWVVVELDRVAEALVDRVDVTGALAELDAVLGCIVEVGEAVATAEELFVGAVVGTTPGADADVEVTADGRVVRAVVEDDVVDDVLDEVAVEQLGNEVVPMRLPCAYT